jgi:hypothetical protein
MRIPCSCGNKFHKFNYIIQYAFIFSGKFYYYSSGVVLVIETDVKFPVSKALDVSKLGGGGWVLEKGREHSVAIGRNAFVHDLQC